MHSETEGPSPAQARKALIEKLCLELRADGKSYDEISAVLSTRLSIPFPSEQAAKAVRAALRKNRHLVQEKAADVIDLDLLRLDGLMDIALREARAGELKGVDAALKIMDRKAKYLGLDAALKQDVKVTQLSHEEALNELE